MKGIGVLGGCRDDGDGYGKMTESSNIIDVWSYWSFRELICVVVGGYPGFSLRMTMKNAVEWGF
jgi:hypothetical protein